MNASTATSKKIKLTAAGWGIVSVVVLCVLAFAMVYGLRGSSEKTGPAEPLAECVSHTAGGAESAADAARVAHLRDIAAFCNTVINGDLLLNDFKIRRAKFEQQSYDEKVMLWMAVVITCLGVGLAGMQFLASYNLAQITTSQAAPASPTSGVTSSAPHHARGAGAFGDSGIEIVVEINKLVVKSWVTGLSVLVISFVFFLVFVYEIYTIRFVDPDGPKPQAQTVSASEPAPRAGYGAPPKK